MKEIKSKEEFFEFISNKTPVLVVFSTHDCATCVPVKEKVERNFKEIPKANVYLDSVKELSGELSIFNVPTVCIYLEGREFYRFVRVFSMDDIKEKLNRLMEYV